MIIVPNAKNIGYPLHALLNRLQHRSSPWGARSWMATAPVARTLRELGLDIVEEGFVDMPPWPGFDAMNLVGRFLRRHTVEGDRPARSDDEVEAMLDRLTVIEYAPLPRLVKTPLAHQLYIVARKPKGH